MKFSISIYYTFITVLFCKNLICQKYNLTANQIILYVSFKLMHWKLNENWKEVLPDTGEHFWGAGLTTGVLQQY